MPLNKPNQLLRSDLKAIAFNLEQSCFDLGKLAEKLSNTGAVALVGERAGYIKQSLASLRA